MSIQRIKKNQVITIEDIKGRSALNADGCWLWVGSKDRDGYGLWRGISSRFGTGIAHRIAFCVANGGLPKWPMVLDHICKNKACVNPEHLRVMHHVENAFLDNPIQEKCPLGHNRWRVRTGKDQGRECLDCRNVFKKRYRARKKAGLV